MFIFNCNGVFFSHGHVENQITSFECHMWYLHKENKIKGKLLCTYYSSWGPWANVIGYT